MNGILCVDKPADFTSFDVIAKLRGILKMRKLGHTGTLDPMATGVLPVLVGKAARAADMLPDTGKAYSAGFRLGVSTDTQDITGTVTRECESRIIPEQLESVFPEFRGDIMQIPPMYSAVSVGGKRLYDLARQGKEIERPARRITVHSLEMTAFDESTQTGTLDISCSGGTYIRTIISDIGDKLGTGAVMTSLRRTRACGFGLSDCLTLDDIQRLADEGTIEEHILPVDQLFSEYPEIRLDERKTGLYRNGVKLTHVITSENDSLYRVYGFDSEFLGLGSYTASEQQLKVRKNFFE